MKKILTLLLALSMVFTYSFATVGTAFADAADQPAVTAYVATAKANMEDAVDAYGADPAAFTYGSDGYLAGGTAFGVFGPVSKAAVEKGLAALKAEYAAKIDAAGADIVAGPSVGAGVPAAIDAAVSVPTTTAAFTAVFEAPASDYAKPKGIVMSAGIADLNAAAQAMIDKVDPADYSTVDGDGSLGSSSQERAIAAKNYVSNLMAAAISAGDKISAQAVYDTLGPSTGLTAPATPGPSTSFADMVDTLVKKASVSTDLEKLKASTKSSIQNLSNTYKKAYQTYYNAIVKSGSATPEDLAEAKARLATADADFKALLEYFTTKIDTLDTDHKPGTDDFWQVTDTDEAKMAAYKTYLDGLLTQASTYYDTASVPGAVIPGLDIASSIENRIAHATSYAAAMKSQYNNTLDDPYYGFPTYVSESVDEVLAAVIVKIKKDDADVQTYEDIEDYMAGNCKTTSDEFFYSLREYRQLGEALIKTTLPDGPLTHALQPSDSAEYSIVNSEPAMFVKCGKEFSDLRGHYDAAEWDEEYRSDIYAIQMDYAQKIWLGTSKTAILALVKEAQAKMDAVALRTAPLAKLKDAIDNSMALLGYAKGTSADIRDGKDGSLAAYAISKNGAGLYSAATRNAAAKKAAKLLYDAVIAKNDPSLSNAEIQKILADNYSKALAVIDAMPTDSAKSTAANAVVSAISALPPEVSLDNKAQFLEVQKKYEDYMDLAGAAKEDISNQSVLHTYMTKLVDLERENAQYLVDMLPRPMMTNVTIGDREKIYAARAAVDAYKNAYSAYESTAETMVTGMDYGYTPIGVSDLVLVEDQLVQIVCREFVKMMNELPTNITAKDQAAVEAARAYYDSMNDSEKAGLRAWFSEYITRLDQAETDLHKTVEKCKITAGSVASKGKIKVSWKVKDGISGVKYQIYRSTHKNYGYGTKPIFTTSKKTYTNTKNLKKGVRYYYKVRAIDTFNGVTYTSDWSNKAFRKAK